MVTPAAKREAVAHLRCAFDMSERRACRTIGCVRMTVRYRSRRPDDAELRQRLRALAHERRRFGYRRLHVLLRREGFTVNHKRLFRLYREERLMVRRRGGRKRALATGTDAGPDMAERPLVAGFCRYQAANVVGQVLQANLRARPGRMVRQKGRPGMARTRAVTHLLQQRNSACGCFVFEMA
jgi:putative transposase